MTMTQQRDFKAEVLAVYPDARPVVTRTDKHTGHGRGGRNGYLYTIKSGDAEISDSHRNGRTAWRSAANRLKAGR